MVHTEFYEALLPLARAELATLRDAGEQQLARLRIEATEAAQSDEHGAHVAVLFRDPERPGCRFGWRWAWAEDPREEELGYAAAMLRVDLEEDLLSERYGLPGDCVPDTITWF